MKDFDVGFNSSRAFRNIMKNRLKSIKLLLRLSMIS